LVEDSNVVIPLEDAAAEPYASIISYPRPDSAALASRIRQLRELGVSQIELTGKLKLGKLSLLGKGVSGMVMIGILGKERVALKLRRVDSRRDSMSHEASMLKAANSVKVGPLYYQSTEDVILMELIEGHSLPEWLSGLTGKGCRGRFRGTTGRLFEQCFRLDDAGIDHGELSRAHKNVCVIEDGQPVILDFESASRNRNPNNLTSIAQYLFAGGGFARRARRVLGPTDSIRLRRALRSYKSERTADSFHSLQELLKLTS
jgi:putative serine/threonine protein kinase